MKGKILFVAGLGVGYVLGARAGRERYESIKKSASKLWNDPRVQKQVDTAEAFVKDKAPDVAEFALDGAKKVVAQVTGKKPATTSRTSTAKSTAAKSAAAKSGTAKSS
jgi:transcriptional accessory protein Tex/SPT6